MSPAVIEEIIRLSLGKVRLTIHTGDEVQFVRRARHELDYIHYKNLRQFGTPLDKERVRALGLRANAKLSVEFVGILNEAGLIDPIEAANVIAQTVEQGLSSMRSVQAAVDAGVTSFKFRASNMAAGPCAEAAAIDGRSIRVTDAVVLPIASCDKLGQCACRYQAELHP
jgi:hypothetical protein